MAQEDPTPRAHPDRHAHSTARSSGGHRTPTAPVPKGSQNTQRNYERYMERARAEALAGSRFASVRFSRAIASGRAGYGPKERTLSTPQKRYFSRHSFLPLGCTTTYKPPPSESLYDFCRGLAARIATSLSTGRIPSGAV